MPPNGDFLGGVNFSLPDLSFGELGLPEPRVLSSRELGKRPARGGGNAYYSIDARGPPPASASA